MTDNVEKALELKDDEDFIGIADEINMEEIAQSADMLMNLIESTRDDKVVKKEQPDPRKVTKSDMQKRIKEILELLNRGFVLAEIYEYGEKRWGCSERTIQRYLEKARKMDTLPERDVLEFRKDNTSRCLYVYRQAIKNKNSNVALNALKEMNKLVGVYPDQIVTVKGDQENPIAILVKAIADGGMKPEDIAKNAIKVLPEKVE